MPYFTVLLALFSGIGDRFLALTFKKPKENHCFWLRTLKNLRKTFVFAFPTASGDPGGTIGPTTPNKNIYHKLPIHRPSGRYVMLWDEDEMGLGVGDCMKKAETLQLVLPNIQPKNETTVSHTLFHEPSRNETKEMDR